LLQAPNNIHFIEETVPFRVLLLVAVAATVAAGVTVAQDAIHGAHSTRADARHRVDRAGAEVAHGGHGAGAHAIGGVDGGVDDCSHCPGLLDRLGPVEKK